MQSATAVCNPEFPSLENISLKRIYESQPAKKPIGVWTIADGKGAKHEISLDVTNAARLEFAHFVNKLSPFQRDKLIHHYQKNDKPATYVKIFPHLSDIRKYMETKLESYAKRMEEGCGLKLAKTVSTHKDQVNTFQSMEEVYREYQQRATRTARLATPPFDEKKAANIGVHEVGATLHHQKSIVPRVRELIAGRGYKPVEQFKSFRELFLQGSAEEVTRLQAIAQAAITWVKVGFTQPLEKEELGLEFLTEYTHTGARMIDNLNAFFYAEFLGKAKEVAEDAWKQFEQTPEFKATAVLRKAIKDLTVPVALKELSDGQEGMSISSALQDFRRKQPPSNLASLLLEKKPMGWGTEELIARNLEEVRKKFEAMLAIVNSFESVEAAYTALRDAPQGTMSQANDLRREIGGTGFLIALQQAIKTKLISKHFYLENRDFIDKLVNLCDAMDKCNFEIVLQFGTYEGDVIPSPYAFFRQLANEVNP